MIFCIILIIIIGRVAILCLISWEVSWWRCEVKKKVQTKVPVLGLRWFVCSLYLLNYCWWACLAFLFEPGNATQKDATSSPSHRRPVRINRRGLCIQYQRSHGPLRPVVGYCSLPVVGRADVASRMKESIVSQ
jgi:hypothetical protein